MYPASSSMKKSRWSALVFIISLVWAGRAEAQLPQKEWRSARTEVVQKAAEHGDVLAQAELSLRLEYGYDGNGIDKNDPDDTGAIVWLIKAAKNGDAESQYRLGVRYMNGTGVLQSPSVAMLWLHAAASQNFKRAFLELGILAANGNDESKSIQFWEKGAALGEPQCKAELGDAYFCGRGVEKNYVVAAEWLKEAAESRITRAQGELGALYAFGDGVPKDGASAYKWSSLAAAHGDEAAKRILSSLEHTLTAEQISKGQDMAREFDQPDSRK